MANPTCKAYPVPPKVNVIGALTTILSAEAAAVFKARNEVETALIEQASTIGFRPQNNRPPMATGATDSTVKVTPKPQAQGQSDFGGPVEPTFSDTDVAPQFSDPDPAPIPSDDGPRFEPVETDVDTVPTPTDDFPEDFPDFGPPADVDTEAVPATVEDGQGATSNVEGEGGETTAPEPVIEENEGGDTTKVEADPENEPVEDIPTDEIGGNDGDLTFEGVEDFP